MKKKWIEDVQKNHVRRIWTTFHKKQHLGAKLGMTGTFAIVAKLFLKISCVSAVRENPFYVPCPRPVLTDRRGVS
jgi:hypothetical protein